MYHYKNVLGACFASFIQQLASLFSLILVETFYNTRVIVEHDRYLHGDDSLETYRINALLNNVCLIVAIYILSISKTEVPVFAKNTV